MNLTPVNAREIIRRILAEDSGRVIFTDHALKRMNERNITRRQVLNCLKMGRVIEGPAPDNMKGDWKLTLETLTAGDNVTVVVAIQEQSNGEDVVIITTYSRSS